MIKSLLVAAFILTSLPLHATEVLDPHGLLADIPSGRVPFSQAFSCPSQRLIYSSRCEVSCSRSFCMTTCDPVAGPSVLAAEECTPESISLFSETGLAFNITKADYDAGQGTWITPFLKSIRQFFNGEPESVTLEMIMPRRMQMIQDGRKEDFLGQMITAAVLFSAGSQPLSVDIFVHPSKSGMDQILQVSMLDDILYKRKGVFFENPY